MLIRPSFYSVFPPNALNNKDVVTVHLGNAHGQVIQIRMLDSKVSSSNVTELRFELSIENAKPLILRLNYTGLPINLLMQVQAGLLDSQDYSSLPAGNLSDFLLDQLSPGEMCSRLGSYVRDRTITSTLLGNEYLSRLKVSKPINVDEPDSFLKRNQTQTLHEKLISINEAGHDSCAGEVGSRQIAALIEAVLGSYVAIEEVFKNPLCFAGASLPMSFSTQMAAWLKLQDLIVAAKNKKPNGIFASSRITYSANAVEKFLSNEKIPLMVTGGHQGLDLILENYAQKQFIPIIKMPKRDLHQDHLLQLIGQQFISDKDHWKSRGAQGRMVFKAFELDHIKQCVPLINTL